LLSSDGLLASVSYLGADLALVSELVFCVLISIAIVVQRREQYYWHDQIQTPTVVLNLFLSLPLWRDHCGMKMCQPSLRNGRLRRFSGHSCVTTMSFNPMS